jgi:hypothetical protein
MNDKRLGRASEATLLAFSGDKLSDCKVLWSTSHGWLAWAEYAYAAALGSGIEISAGTIERWFRFGAYSYWLDQLIDEQPTTNRTAAYQVYKRLVGGEEFCPGDMPEWVDPNLIAVARLFNNAISELGEGETHQARAMALQILECAEVKADQRRAWRYGAVVVREGQLVGALMAELMTPQERHGRRYGRFKRWFGQLGATAALADSIDDLELDFCAQRSAVRPTRVNRLIMLSRCLWIVAQLTLRPKIFAATVVGFLRSGGVSRLRKREIGGSKQELRQEHEPEVLA